MQWRILFWAVFIGWDQSGVRKLNSEHSAWDCLVGCCSIPFFLHFSPIWPPSWIPFLVHSCCLVLLEHRHWHCFLFQSIKCFFCHLIIFYSSAFFFFFSKLAARSTGWRSVQSRWAWMTALINPLIFLGKWTLFFLNFSFGALGFPCIFTSLNSGKVPSC